MKKVLAWVLLLTLVLGAFAGCKPQSAQNDPTQPAIKGPTAADAIDYLKGFYTDSGKQTPVDYTRFGIVRVGGIAFDVVWTVDVGEDLVKVVANEDGTVTIDINEQCEADTDYVLTATITDAQGNTASHSWNYILPEAVDMVELVKTAYALQPGESLPYESRLIGKIISIDSIWSDDYQNVTVTIEVEGAEDMPIKCYRMKANETTLEAAKNLLVGNIITVSGVLKNYEGTIEFDAGCILEKVEKGDAIEAPTDPIEIVKAAYALPQNAALPYPATLTGSVTAIDNPYDPQYGNISVIISIEGAEAYPILCYRLKGVDVEKIAIGDLITVTGIIKNYKGTIEYDAGCIMTNRVSGGGVAQGPSSDPAKIIPDALKLAPGESLPYRATLTGVVYSVDTPYDPNYGNVTVTMKVQGYKFQCYRMVGDGIDQIRESDTITVSGVIKNYNGKLEFDAKCNLDNWTMGPRTVNYGPLVEETAYRMYMEQNAIGKTLYFNGKYSGSRLSTSAKGSEGVDIFLERVSGKGVRFYFMDGETKTYIEVEDYYTDEGKLRGRAKVTTEPSVCWTYSPDHGLYLANVGAGKHFLGSYNTYETITASWVGYIEDANAGNVGKTQFVAKFMAASDVPADGPSQGGATGELVKTPVAGVPYKWGLEQKNKGVNLYFTGTMAGFYGATTEDITKAVDVILEEVPGGGYYVTFKDASGAKKYVTVTLENKDGKTYRNFTIADTASTVYTYNAEYNTLVTTVDGDDVYIGTYNDFTTFSVSFFSKISSSFPSHFYTVGEGGEVEPEQPTEPAGPQETIPVATDKLSDGDKVVIYAPAYGKALSAEKVTATSFYNKGVDVTIADGKLNGYGNTEIWTVVENADGIYSFAYNGQTIALGEQFSSMNLGEVYDEWELVSQDGTLYYIRNIGRNMYMEWYSSKDNWSAFTTPKTDEFEMSIYIIGKGLLGYATEEPEPTEPTVPDVTEPSTGVGIVTDPKVGVAYKWGIEQNNISKTLYFNGEMAKTYYGGTTESFNDAVDVSLEAANGGYYLTFKDASGAKKYINIVVKVDGTKTHRNFTIADKAATVYTWNAEYNTLQADVEGTACYFGTYNTFDTFSVSVLDKIGTSFPAHFYAEGQGTEPQPTEPTVPDVTEPSTGVGVVTKPAAGTAYKWGIEQNNISKTLYFNGEMAKTYYGGTTESFDDAVDVSLEAANGGYYLTFKDASGAKKYINIVVKVDGTKTHRNFTIADKAATVYTWNAEYNTLQADVEGTACYFGTYNTFDTFSVSVLDKIGTSFPAHFYAEGQGTEPQPTEPTVPDVTEPSGSVALNTGDKVVIFAPAYGMALSADKVNETSFYNKGVEVTVSGGVLTGYGNAEIWTVSDNGNGTYSFASNGMNIGLADQYSSMNLDAIYDEWELISLGNGLYHIKNVGRGMFMEWYSSKNNWSAYSSAKSDEFEMSIYVIGEGILGDAKEEPEATEPEATEPSTGSGFNKITSASQFTSGKYVMIVNTGYAPGVYDNKWLSAAQPTVSGNAVTNTDGAVWTLTVNGSSVVITDANGVTIKPMGGNKNGVMDGSYDWDWSFDNGTFVFAGTGEDVVYLASNTSTTGQYPGNHRFRGYKITTIEDHPDEYPWQFTLYKMGGEYVEPEVTEPEATEPTVPEATEPVGGSAELKNGDKVVIYAPAYGMALSADKVNETSFYNKGVEVTISNGVMTGYGNAEIWTVSDNGNGTYSFANNGMNIGLGDQYSSMNLDAIYDEWELISLGNGLYHIKNVGRGMFMEWYSSKNNWSAYSSAKSNEFEMSFYVIGEGVVGGGNGGNNEPEATEPEASEPVVDGEAVSINFKEYPKGEQYAVETYDLGNGITLDIEHCHMNSQLRIYQDAKNGYDGKAIFSCANVIQAITLNTGYRAATMEVYGSEDGRTWELVEAIAHPTKDGYADYTVVMPAGKSYKYLMLDTVETQMRVTAMSFIFKK